MEITVELPYGATVSDVGRLLADETFIRWRAEQTCTPGGAVALADVTGSAEGSFTIATRRTIPNDQIPAQLAHIIGSMLEVRQTEAWGAPGGDERVGTIALEITGAPVRIRGTVALRPTAGGCVQTYHGDIKAALPLVGRMLEDAAASAVRAGLAAEAEATRRWLATDPPRQPPASAAPPSKEPP